MMPPGTPGMPGAPGYGYMPPQPPRGNGAAIGSLICGILGCIPFLTGLLAVILGIVGLRKTRDPAVGGKGMAIAGLILGLISILGWGAFSALGGAVWVAGRPVRNAASQFVTDVANGNTQAALNESSGMTTEEIEGYTKTWKSYGTVQNIILPGYSVVTVNGTTTAKVGGAITFSNGQAKSCTLDLVQQNGTYKVTAIVYQ